MKFSISTLLMSHISIIVCIVLTCQCTANQCNSNCTAKGSSLHARGMQVTFSRKDRKANHQQTETVKLWGWDLVLQLSVCSLLDRMTHRKISVIAVAKTKTVWDWICFGFVLDYSLSIAFSLKHSLFFSLKRLLISSKPL